MTEELEGYKADTFWGRVGFGVPTELAGEAKADFPQSVHPGVFGPHAGIDLHNRAEIGINCAFFNWLALCFQDSTANMLGKDLEGGYFFNGVGEICGYARPHEVFGLLGPSSAVLVAL
eukprot:11273307-Ditylum_brightwellii.AAC.1